MTSNPSERDGRTWPKDHPEAFSAGRCDVILSWMKAKRAAKGNRPVLWSEAMYELGLPQFDADWQGLINEGVIEAVFPEARPGDSGRQFWDFAHWAAEAA